MKKIEGGGGELVYERNLTTVIYALQAASFVLGITYFAAIILNYAKFKDVKGTWLESHFRWQINTFWYSLLWGVLGALLLIFLVGYMILIADLIWVIFRIAVGWVRLSERKPIVNWQS
ncbi:MAG: hypothetical protein ABFS02_04735 [Pseudomonadota bacterium]